MDLKWLTKLDDYLESHPSIARTLAVISFIIFSACIFKYSK